MSDTPSTLKGPHFKNIEDVTQRREAMVQALRGCSAVMAEAIDSEDRALILKTLFLLFRSHIEVLVAAGFNRSVIGEGGLYPNIRTMTDDLFHAPARPMAKPAEPVAKAPETPADFMAIVNPMIRKEAMRQALRACSKKMADSIDSGMEFRIWNTLIELSKHPSNVLAALGFDERVLGKKGLYPHLNALVKALFPAIFGKHSDTPGNVRNF